MKTSIIIGFLLAACHLGFGQVSTESLEANGLSVLFIANINGHVTVQGSDRSDVLSQSEVIVAEPDAKVSYQRRSDTLYVYIQSPGISFRPTRRKSKDRQWGSYQWPEHQHDFAFRTDLTLQTPKHLEVIVSTINKGDIVVKGISRPVSAQNVNGHVTLTQVSEIKTARTINGNVTIDFTENPSLEGSYYTLNGDIEALFGRGLAANISFKSFNGDFYTNIRDMKTLPATIKQVSAGSRVQYKIEGAQLQVGEGGVQLDFETFNGDVILKTKN